MGSITQELSSSTNQTSNKEIISKFVLSLNNNIQFPPCEYKRKSELFSPSKQRADVGLLSVVKGECMKVLLL